MAIGFRDFSNHTSLLILVCRSIDAASFITPNFSTLVEVSSPRSSFPCCAEIHNDKSHDGASRRQVLGTVALLTVLTLPTAVVFSVTPNPLARFDTVDRIPPSYFDRHLRLYAYTERVIDGDTIRVRHIPGYNWPVVGGKVPPEPKTKTKKKRGIADETLILRLYGVDCPELSKKNATAPQPFALEAKQFTSSQVYHQMVAVTLLSKDRYGRAIAMVETVPSSLFARAGTDLSVELARQGLAQLYTGGGAEYNVRCRLAGGSRITMIFLIFCHTHLLLCTCANAEQTKRSRKSDPRGKTVPSGYLVVAVKFE
jgi:endonuclease YncB( thermonuclease family)